MSLDHSAYPSYVATTTQPESSFELILTIHSGTTKNPSKSLVYFNAHGDFSMAGFLHSAEGLQGGGKGCNPGHWHLLKLWQSKLCMGLHLLPHYRTFFPVEYLTALLKYTDASY